MQKAINFIEHHFKEKITEQTVDAESVDYFGCHFKTVNYSIKYRKAKITPKKIGAFVALWKRDTDRNTIPYDQEDPFDFYIIEVEDHMLRGFFLFPKQALIDRNILSSKKEGKRGFRLYMSWNVVASAQALKTQAWQLPYFVNLNNPAIVLAK